jgi:ketosteroid isomerase-like protein
MADTNVDVARGMWDPFNGLEISSIDWDNEAVRGVVAPHLSSDVELSWSATWAGERHYSGIDGFFQAFKEWLEPFSEYHAEAIEFIEVGDRVVVPNRQWGTGRESGVPVEIEVAHVYEFEDGLIVRVDEYDSKTEALEAIAAPGTAGER